MTRRLTGASLAVSLIVGLISVSVVPAVAALKPRLAKTLWVAPSTGRATLSKVCRTAAYDDVNAAISAAMPGDNVEVCPGTYTGSVTITTSSLVQPTITTGVEVNKAINLVGLHGAIINANGLDNGVTFYDAAGAKLKGFTIAGALGEGVYAVISTRLLIEDNLIHNNDSGTQTSGYSECRTTAGLLSSCGYGVHLVSVTNSDIVDNTVEFNSGGILLTDEYGPTHGDIVENNHVEDNKQRSGISLDGVSASAVKPNGKPTPQQGGVYANSVTGNVIMSNGTTGYAAADNATGYGSGILLIATAEAGGSYDNLVHANKISGNGHSGITIYKQYAPSDVSGNVISNNWIGTNDVSNTSTTGIYVGRASTTVPQVYETVIDNTIAHDYFGLYDNAGGVTRFGNHFVKVVVNYKS
jgi:nitrous oxidase accessory protein NosD